MHELAERTSRESLDSRGSEPRAVVHKNILDRAAADPEAPMSELASDVPGATVGLVERVLEEYGDPGTEDDEPSETSADTAAEAHDETTDSEPEPMAERTLDAHPTGVPDAESLTEKQRATLRAIRERPEATQAELADRLGVSSATINTRVNAIDGFDWSRRRAFVDRLFGDAAAGPAGADGPVGTDDATAANGDGGANAVTEANTVNERNEAAATNERNEPNDPDETNGQNDSGDADGPNEQDTATNQDGLDETDERKGTNGPNDNNGAREGGAADGPDRPDRSNREDPTDSIGTSTGSKATHDRQSIEPLADRIEELTAVVESVASRVDEPDRSTTGAFEDPELVHKILRACLNDDDISPDEELEIVRAVVG